MAAAALVAGVTLGDRHSQNNLNADVVGRREREPQVAVELQWAQAVDALAHADPTHGELKGRRKQGLGVEETVEQAAAQEY